MCSLCGVMGGGAHWSNSGDSPEAFAGRGQPHTRQRERQERVRLVNRILSFYGLRLQDWQGVSYRLQNKTGQTLLVDNLSDLWAAAEKIRKNPCDPLDPALLSALSAGL